MATFNCSLPPITADKFSALLLFLSQQPQKLLFGYLPGTQCLGAGDFGYPRVYPHDEIACLTGNGVLDRPALGPDLVVGDFPAKRLQCACNDELLTVQRQAGCLDFSGRPDTGALELL